MRTYVVDLRGKQSARDSGCLSLPESAVPCDPRRATRLGSTVARLPPAAQSRAARHSDWPGYTLQGSSGRPGNLVTRQGAQQGKVRRAWLPYYAALPECTQSRSMMAVLCSRGPHSTSRSPTPAANIVSHRHWICETSLPSLLDATVLGGTRPPCWNELRTIRLSASRPTHRGPSRRARITSRGQRHLRPLLFLVRCGSLSIVRPTNPCLPRLPTDLASRLNPGIHSIGQVHDKA